MSISSFELTYAYLEMHALKKEKKNIKDNQESGELNRLVYKYKIRIAFASSYLFS